MEKGIQTSDKFCSNCGQKLYAQQVGAESIVKYGYEVPYHPFSAYDSKTGERNMGVRYFCPSSHWWNSHSDFCSLLLEDNK